MLKVVSKIIVGTLTVIGVWALCGGGMLELIRIVSPRAFESFLEDLG